jgi:hypothetical protein
MGIRISFQVIAMNLFQDAPLDQALQQFLRRIPR